jgi:hypothetical protein
MDAVEIGTVDVFRLAQDDAMNLLRASNYLVRTEFRCFNQFLQVRCHRQFLLLGVVLKNTTASHHSLSLSHNIFAAQVRLVIGIVERIRIDASSGL